MKKKFTKELVDEYADKLYIRLTSKENKMVLEEFDVIDANIDIINNIEGLKDVEPMSWCLDNEILELRSDEPVNGVDIEDLLSNCDEKTDREVEIPRVVA